MEIEQLKSATTTEDEMEMMSLMDKLPHFFSPNNDHHHQHLTHEFLELNNNAKAPNIFAHSPPEFVTNIHSSPSISFNTNNQLEHQWSDYDIMASNNSNNTNIDDQYASLMTTTHLDINSMTTQKRNSSIAAMREMIFRIAVMQPVHIDPESVKPPKRRNVKISKDPQSVAARHRRERISERIRILQRLVPGGTKMDTASMLDEAIHYVKFLKTQVQSLERAQATNSASTCCGIGFPVAISAGSSYFHHQSPTSSSSHNLQHYGDSN